MPASVQRLKHKLHPQTGFMIFFPGTVLLVLFVLVALSHGGAKWSVLEGIAATLGIGVVAIGFGLYSDLGNAVEWDSDSVYVRQGGSRFFFRRHPFASVPFSGISGLTFHPPPRGVPPKYPLLELNAGSHAHGPPLLIDPNYFTRLSLALFITELCERRPQVREGKQGKAIDGLLKRLRG